ncbi:adenylate kinase [Prevotella sp. oral taxon 820]|nr:adenylate kinase [Prevotella sp. oral taxon 820]
MPSFGKRQSKTDVKCRASANAKAKQMLNSGLRQTPKQKQVLNAGLRQTPKQNRC